MFLPPARCCRNTKGSQVGAWLVGCVHNNSLSLSPSTTSIQWTTRGLTKSRYQTLFHFSPMQSKPTHSRHLLDRFSLSSTFWVFIVLLKWIANTWTLRTVVVWIHVAQKFSLGQLQFLSFFMRVRLSAARLLCCQCVCSQTLN